VSHHHLWARICWPFVLASVRCYSFVGQSAHVSISARGVDRFGHASYPIIPNPEIQSYKHQLHYIKYVTKDKQVYYHTIHAEKVEGNRTKSNLLLPHERRCLLPPIVSIIFQVLCSQKKILHYLNGQSLKIFGLGQA
jgi:hypothetical protein